jgi:hypothetical protein
VLSYICLSLCLLLTKETFANPAVLLALSFTGCLQYLQNLIETAEKIVQDHDTAARSTTTEPFSISSTLLLANNGRFPSNLGAAMLHGDPTGGGEVVALMQELGCINQRISVLHHSASFSAQNGRLQQQQQQVGQETAHVWQSLLQEQQAHIARQQQQGNTTTLNRVNPASPLVGPLPVASAAGGPNSSVGVAFQSSAPVPQQTWLQSSSQMQQQEPGAAVPRRALGASTLPSQYVISGTVPLLSHMYHQLLPTPAAAGGGSSLMNHPPHVHAAFPGYLGAATIQQPPVPPSWPSMMIGQVAPQSGLPQGEPTLLPPAAMWGQPPAQMQHILQMMFAGLYQNDPPHSPPPPPDPSGA